MRAHIRKPLSARHSRKKRLLTLLTSRLFIIVVLILLQLFLLLFTLVELGTRQYWISIAFNILSFLMVLWILPREDNPSYKISWIILIMAIPLVGGIFYLMFGMKRNSRRMARQIDSYTRSLLHRDHGKVTLNPNDSLSQPTPLQQLSLIDPMLGRQAGYISSTSGFEVYRNTQVEYFSLGEQFYQRLLEQLRGAQKFILMEYFIVQHGKMWDSILRVLEERQRHGVQVRILYDDVGCVTTLPAMYSEQLRQKGFQVGVFNPFHPRLNAATNYRDHRKICVIDGNVGFTGGINLADEYINEKEKHGHWKDTAVLLRGQGVQGLTEMFLELWQFTCQEKLHLCDFLPNESFLAPGFVQPYGDSPMRVQIDGTGYELCPTVWGQPAGFLQSGRKRLYADSQPCARLCLYHYTLSDFGQRDALRPLPCGTKRSGCTHHHSPCARQMVCSYGHPLLLPAAAERRGAHL